MYQTGSEFSLPGKQKLPGEQTMGTPFRISSPSGQWGGRSAFQTGSEGKIIVSPLDFFSGRLILLFFEA